MLIACGVKRKRNEDSATADAEPSTRATRSSARNSTNTSPAASTSKTAAKKAKEDDGDQSELEVPPPKKSKATKSSTKATPAKTKTTKGKKSAGSPTNVKTVYSDDGVIAQKGSIPETSTPTTINEPPPIPAPKPPPPSRSSSTNEPYSAARAHALFQEYEDNDDPNTIGSEGFVRLCTDANIAMDGSQPLLLAWQLGTKEMMKITAEEWRKGTESLK
ncbi:hypothetical protein H0H87_004991 [Tephrocybe sp. NHM501043]|nr:hypothetical protein H0H87_004991 [Tephrocybe sp. NHM501043]